MKRIEDIERMDEEQLISCADNSCPDVPENIESIILDSLSASVIVEHPKKRSVSFRWYPVACILSVAAVALLVLILSNVSTQRDTFTDPELAYAELKKTFEYISSKTGVGLDIVSDAESIINHTNEVVFNIISEK